jgi:hypothetical protein
MTHKCGCYACTEDKELVVRNSMGRVVPGVVRGFPMHSHKDDAEIQENQAKHDKLVSLLEETRVLIEQVRANMNSEFMKDKFDSARLGQKVFEEAYGHLFANPGKGWFMVKWQISNEKILETKMVAITQQIGRIPIHPQPPPYAEAVLCADLR